MIGDGGANRLFGGAGDDNLTGGAGIDTFVLNAPGTGVDTITDFQHAVDVLEIGFGSYSPGDTPSLVSGTGGPSGIFSGGGQGFGFDTGTGQLYYSLDGSVGNAVLVAYLQNVTTLTASDLHIA